MPSIELTSDKLLQHNIMEKIRATKPTYEEPIIFQPRHDRKPAFYALHNHGEVTTSSVSKRQLRNGHTMALVHIRAVADLGDPSNDIAAIIGTIVRKTRSGNVYPQSPELWYWQDKFWVKAVTADDMEYYRTHTDGNGNAEKCYAFCEVEIDDPSTILGQLDFS